MSQHRATRPILCGNKEAVSYNNTILGVAGRDGLGFSTMNAPTDKQQAVLEYVRSFVMQNGYSPTMKEISTHFGWWPNAAMVHCQLLEKKGLLRKTPRGYLPV